MESHVSQVNVTGAGNCSMEIPSDASKTNQLVIMLRVYHRQDAGAAALRRTTLVISSVELLRQVRPDSAIAQSRHAASSSDYQLADKLCEDL